MAMYKTTVYLPDDLKAELERWIKPLHNVKVDLRKPMSKRP